MQGSKGRKGETHHDSRKRHERNRKEVDDKAGTPQGEAGREQGLVT